MQHVWSIRCLLLYFLVFRLHFHYTNAAWPSLDNSSIQLLGLFPDPPNASQAQTSTMSVHARAMFKAAIMLSRQFNMTIDGQLLGWQVAQTGGTVIGAVSSTCRLIPTSNIVGIVGPALSREAPVISDLAGTIGIPTVSYGATAPELADENAYPAFYRTIPSDHTAASALVKLFAQYNWTSCIILYQDDEYGDGGVNAITQEFNNNNLVVAQTLLYEISTQTFRNDLKTVLLSNPSRIVILWAESVYATSILQEALDNDLVGPQFLWILSSSVSLNSFNQTSYSKLVGMITIEPTVGSVVNATINSTLLNAAYNMWQQYEPETFPGSSQVNNYGLFAFDATWTLIESLGVLCSTEMNDSLPCLSIIESSFCFDCRFVHRDQFFRTINSIRFLGVSGAIQFSNDTNDRINGTYYILKNIHAPSTAVQYMPVLQWDDSGNWETAIGASVIIWPGNSLVPPSGLPALTGVTLRIAVVNVAPFTMITEVPNQFGQNMTVLVGYANDIIDILQKNLGFTAQVILVPSNQTFDQTVAAVADNIYDLVVSDVTITASRREIVDFSNSIFDNSLRVIIRDGSSYRVDLISYLRPFSLRLWLVLLAALLYSSILIFILERRGNDAMKERSMISAAAMSIWYSFGTLLGYGVDFHVQTAAGRLLSVGLYILSIILVASYTANLASDLTLTKSNNFITGIDDIKNGKIPPSRVGIVAGGAVEEYYLREVSGGKRNYHVLKSQSEIYSALLNKIIDASISDTGLLEYAVNNKYCNLTLVGSDFDPSAYGIVLRKDWLYTQALDVEILSLRESGTLDSLKRKWFQGNICGDTSAEQVTSYAIQSLGGLFLTFFVITILSLFLFAWLKRFIIKDFFMGLAYRKGWLVKKNVSDKAHSTKNSNGSAKIAPSSLDVPTEVPV